MTTSMLDVWAVGNAVWHEALTAAFGRGLEPEELEPTTWELVEHGRGMSAVDLSNALDHLEAAAWQIAAFFDEYDLWLTPTLAQDYDNAFNPWNPIANICGSPAASLPLYWTADGLPIGTMLTAGFGDEARLISVSAALERADPWAGRIPDVALGAERGRPAAADPRAITG